MFVVTPHHLQRRAVLAQLASLGEHCIPLLLCATSFHSLFSMLGLRFTEVNTVEKMQGREADFVIVCYGYLDPQVFNSVGHVSFLFSFHRLNVAVSRAKSKVVFIASDSVLNPPLTVLTSAADGPKGCNYVQMLKANANFVEFRS